VTFVALDGLRGIAAIAVAVRHAPFLWPDGFPAHAFRESYLAVDFFFVLSGFVIAHAYEQRLLAGMSFRQFMTARLIRLYPLYFLALVLSLLIPVERAITGKIDPGGLAANALPALFFLPSPYSATDLFPLNIPAWSLFFELLINCVFGVAAKRLASLALAVAVLAAGSVLVLSVSSGWLGFGFGRGPMDAGTRWDEFGAGLARVCFSFFAGVLALRLWRYRLIQRSIPPYILAGALCLIMVLPPPPGHQALWDLFAALLLFPAIVFLGANSKTGAGAGRIFGWLGAVSYGVYVLQLPIYDMEFTFGRVAAGGAARLSTALGLSCIASVIVFAWISYAGFDLPVRRAIAEWVRGRSRRPKLGQAASVG
jgi:peptidoglycan/LPS O-acetylase OafA/YrhL